MEPGSTIKQHPQIVFAVLIEQDLRLQLVLAAYLGVSAAAASALRLRRQVPALLLGVGLIVAPWLRPRFV